VYTTDSQLVVQLLKLRGVQGKAEWLWCVALQVLGSAGGGAVVVR